MAADSALLQAVPLFERLDASERSLLADELDEVAVAANEHVFRKGDPGGAIFIVASGAVELYMEDTTGQRLVFETARTGDFFGELSLLDGEPRSASARAVEATQLLRVDRGDLSLLFARHPGAAMDVLAAMSRRLREADRLLGTRPLSSPNEAVEERLTPVMRVADAAATFSGSFSFLLVHALWFFAWIGLNLRFLPDLEPFDPFPFGLLTMVVSLEAIFLSCMVLISQSRQAAKERIRSDVEYEANIRAGLEVTQLHAKVDNLYEQVLARLAKLEKAVGPKAP